MKIDVPGLNSSYRPGENPAVDEIIQTINKELGPCAGGFIYLDEHGNPTDHPTEKMVINIPGGTPYETMNKIRRAIAVLIVKLMAPAENQESQDPVSST